MPASLQAVISGSAAGAEALVRAARGGRGNRGVRGVVGRVGSMFPRWPSRLNPFFGKQWALFPWRLFAVVMALFVIGFVCIFAASLVPTPDGEVFDAGYQWRQLVWLGAALLVLYVVLRVPYQRLARLSPLWYLLSIVALIAVWKFGVTVNGAQRWLRIPGIDLLIQPAEFIKVAVILALAQWFRFRKSHRQWTGLFVPAVIVAIPLATPGIGILFQPDLGTSISMVPIALGILFAAGVRMRHMIVGILGMIGAVPIALLCGLLKQYQVDRLTAFLNPDAHVRDIGYQVVQSKTAIGAGGFAGRGFAQGSQNTLGYLPENHTDFIFAVVGEEWGFLGCTLVIALYAALLTMILLVAYRCREPVGRLVVVGIGMLFAYQVFENIGMTVGLSPCTGLTLPFLSYGGSSLVANFLAIGLVMNVAMHPSRSFAAEADSR